MNFITCHFQKLPPSHLNGFEIDELCKVCEAAPNYVSKLQIKGAAGTIEIAVKMGGFWYGPTLCSEVYLSQLKPLCALD